MSFISKGAVISLLFGLLGFIIDRSHKFYQINIKGWSGGELIPVTGFFDYLLVWNRGVSFGLFKTLPPVILVTLIGAAFLALVIWWLKANSQTLRIGLALCLGGALSNIIDRWFYGAVADFFHFYVGKYSFFVFNIADVLISIGVFLLLIDMLIPEKTLKDQQSQ